ncbi:MotA/TolQ/ExbB proton channel family protein [bacterium]|nr:MotA/TolQ/ExbB proton channel family protein [bacterium]
MLEIFHKGGPVMYPLLVCSLISLTVIIERTFFWIIMKTGCGEKQLNELMEFYRRKDWQNADRITGSSGNYVIRVLSKGISQEKQSVSKAMESFARDEVQKMKRFMMILDTIITAAPLIGILGTVIGIILSFDMLGAGIEDPKVVTGGIAQALITTAYGLIIAILTLFPYNFFNSTIEDAVQTIEKYGTQLEIMLTGLQETDSAVSRTSDKRDQ